MGIISTSTTSTTSSTTSTSTTSTTTTRRLAHGSEEHQLEVELRGERENMQGLRRSLDRRWVVCSTLCCAVMWCGMVWCGVVVCGVLWCCEVCCGVLQYAIFVVSLP